MVRVLMTGSGSAAQPKAVAVQRLQKLNDAQGMYRPAEVSALSQDTVSFGNHVEAMKASPLKAFGQQLSDSAKTTGVVLAGSVVGGVAGALLGDFGLVGLLLGALSAGGILGVQHMMKNNAVLPDAVKPVGPVENPFKLVDLAETEAVSDEVSSRDLAIERLHSAIAEDAIEPVVEEKSNRHSGTIEFGGKTYALRNLSFGMVPNTYNAFADERPALKFRAIRNLKTSELPKSDVLFNAAAHNLVDPLAVITLGKEGAKVGLFDSIQQKLTTLEEAVLWSKGQHAP